MLHVYGYVCAYACTHENSSRARTYQLPIWPAATPSKSGHGVGNCWQSFLFGEQYSGGVVPMQLPTYAIPTLSVWIRGIGFLAHVDPFGCTVQTESSTNMPLIGYLCDAIKPSTVSVNQHLKKEEPR